MTSSRSTVDPATEAEYKQKGWWGTDCLTDVIRRHAADKPDGTAFVDEHGDRMSWRVYDELSDRIASALMSTDLAPGERIIVFMADGPLVHATFVGAEKAGLVVMGIGHRAGESELNHLVGKSNARGIITLTTHRDEPSTALVARLREIHPSLEHHIVIDGPSTAAAIAVVGGTSAHTRDPGLRRRIDARRVNADQLFFLNSTSGTTGLPKCVMQNQNRWFFFNQIAVDYGGLTENEVWMSVVPAPFGFGLWTAHFTPTILGVPCAVMGHFNAEGMIRLVEREKVTVLCCVSTQFIMMLNSPALDDHDLSSLRMMFTGGEAIPYARALEFEERTGAMVMNFYGSNETGMLSGTRHTDDRQHRLTTGGRLIPEMHTRLYTPEGQRVEGDRGKGVPACRGPAMSPGYYEDDAANAKLFTPDGWMLMGDIVTVDDDEWLTVVGRTSDFIIRGGKNISAPAVEDEVGTHPAVKMVAVVPAPDPVFGERVAAYVELHHDAALTLDDLKAHLTARGVSKEWYPEYLFVVDQLPRASGGKVAKGELKKDAETRVTATR
jgi:acyl-CoA synthetase